MADQPPGISSDKYLVNKVLHGDRQAYAQIVARTERLVIQIIFKMISNAEDRKDLAQEIYLKAYRNLSRFNYESKLSTWIAQISYNSCIDYLRKKEIILVDSEYEGYEESSCSSINYSVDPPIEILFQKNLASILKDELEKLSPIYQTLITLYHQEDMTYEEISQITALPIGTVKNYLFRARKVLKQNLLMHYKKEDL